MRTLRLVAGILVATSVLPACRQQPRAEPAPFRLRSFPGRGFGDQEVGYISILLMQPVVVRAPATILRVAPTQVDPGLEVVAVRAFFEGPGEFSASGHRKGDFPLVSCWKPGVVRGFGRSYPVEGLQIATGDQFSFVLYARSIKPGRWTASGIRVDYEMSGREPASISGEGKTLEVYARRHGDPPTSDHEYIPCIPNNSDWVTPVSGFPSGSPGSSGG